MIYVFFADGFEDIEAITPVDLLRRSGKTVTTVGIGGKTVSSSHNIMMHMDLNENEFKANDSMEMIVLPGGPGHVHLKDNPAVEQAIAYALANDKYIAAICAAPSILGYYNVLSGKKATCFPGYESYLTGAEKINQDVVVDGKVITANGAGSSIVFSLALIEALCGKEKALEIGSAIQFYHDKA